MLRASFCHVNGIGVRGETRLWESGVLNWDYFSRVRPRFLSHRTYASACRQIHESKVMLEKRRVGYFLDRLPGLHKIRVLYDFACSVAFLDIETTGLGSEVHPTTAAVYDGASVQTFIYGQNMDKLQSVIDAFALVMTYNGRRFDLPVLRMALGLTVNGAHLDLCPLLRGIGYRGGLKQSERLAGVVRTSTRSVNGARAAKLWELYVLTGDERALALLAAYNAQDALSLEVLAWKAHRRSMERYPHRLRADPLHQPNLDVDPAWERLFFND